MQAVGRSENQGGGATTNSRTFEGEVLASIPALSFSSVDLSLHLSKIEQLEQEVISKFSQSHPIVAKGVHYKLSDT